MTTECGLMMKNSGEIGSAEERLEFLQEYDGKNI
jgi:hypothetical protein